MNQTLRWIFIFPLLIYLLTPTQVRAKSNFESTDTEDVIEKDESHILEIVPFDQHDSRSPYNDYDCFIASMYMAMEFFGEDVNYDALVELVRGEDKNELPADPSFVYFATQGRLSAKGKYTSQLAQVIESELVADRPLVIPIRDMSLLAENWNLTGAHSVIVYGIYKETIFYVDPFNGERYTMPLQSFVDASVFPHGSYVITFENKE